MFEFAKEKLIEKKYKLQSDFIPVRIMPWSCVYSIKTDKGLVFFKQMEKVFSFEIIFYDLIKNDNLPKVIASNYEDMWLLEEDGGNVLRSIFQKKYDVNVAKKVVEIYADIQINNLSIVSKLLEKGCLNYSLSNFLYVLENFLKNKDFLLKDGLTEDEFSKLKDFSYLKILLKKIESFNLPMSIEHGDFHDNNILVKNNKFIINDFGDVIISHPFFSIISFLRSAKRNHNITKGVEESIKKAYLLKWIKYGSYNDLVECIKQVDILNYLKWSISFYRVPKGALEEEYKGMIAESIRKYLKKY